MIGSFALSATTQVLIIISGLVFLLIAGLQLIGISAKQKAPLITRFLGFLFLAVATVSPTLTFINSLTAGIVSIISALLIATSYFLKRRPAPSEDVSTKSSSPSISTPNVKPTQSTKDVNPQPISNKPSFEKLQQPAKAVITPAETMRSAIKKETGIRSKPLIRLPAQRRKKARTVVNTLVGFVVFLLVGWGSYAVAKRIIKPQESLDVSTLRMEETAPAVTPQDNEQLNVVDEDVAEETEQVEEVTEVSAYTPEEVKVEQREMVTIKDTETGWLNVREGASTAGAIITKIDPGDSFELLEENEGGTWYKIQIDDESAGWISAKYADKGE